MTRSRYVWDCGPAMRRVLDELRESPGLAVGQLVARLGWPRVSVEQALRKCLRNGYARKSTFIPHRGRRHHVYWFAALDPVPPRKRATPRRNSAQLGC